MTLKKRRKEIHLAIVLCVCVYLVSLTLQIFFSRFQSLWGACHIYIQTMSYCIWAREYIAKANTSTFFLLLSFFLFASSCTVCCNNEMKRKRKTIGLMLASRSHFNIVACTHILYIGPLQWNNGIIRYCEHVELFFRFFFIYMLCFLSFVAFTLRLKINIYYANCNDPRHAALYLG